MQKRKNVLLMLNARKFLDPVSCYAASHNWRITLMNDGESPQGWSGDGALVSYSRSFTQMEYIRRLSRQDIPLVGLSYVYPELKMHRVIVDFAGVGRLGAKHLFERDYKSFAFCSTDRIPGARIAYDAYLDELRRFGHTEDVPWFVNSDAIPPGKKQDWKTVSGAISKFLKPLEKPLGVVCLSDSAAISILDVAVDCGYTIPSEIGVIGSNDNSTICENQQVPLSSLNPNHAQMAFRACGMLDKLMNGEKLPADPVVIPPLGIFERESTGMPSVANPLVIKAVNVMNQHLSEAFSLSELSNTLGISPSKLNRVFHDAGCGTPASLMRLLRIRKSKSLLRTTDLTLSQIAKATGFAHAAHYLNVFRSYTGETPSKWRDRWR